METVTQDTEGIRANLNKFGPVKVVIGIPCYNEEKSIARIVLQLRGLADKILICDDGSSDMTAEIARALGCRVVSHPRNLGKGAALRSLFLAAEEENCGVFLTIDGDGQHNPRDVSRLVMPIIQDGLDIVIGSRFENVESESEMPGYRKLGSAVINSLVRKTSGAKLKDTQSGFRAYNGKALSKLIPGEDGFAADAEILSLAESLGMKIREVPTKISYADDLETSTENPVSHSMQLIGGSIKFVSLRHPLLFYGIPCIVLFVISLVFGSWTLLFYSVQGRIPFGPALATVFFFIVSTVLGAVGVILYSMSTLIKQRT